MRYIKRFTLTERIHHVILFVTFMVLSFTGWPLKYPEVSYSKVWIKIWGGPASAQLIHRIAGVIMVLGFLWHVVYVANNILKRRYRFSIVTTIIPTPKDVLDFIQNVLYMVGVTKERPKFGRYSYLHKFDYWAVFWGMGFIGLTGLMMTFPAYFSRLVPDFAKEWIWDVCFYLHSDEALLAVVFIYSFHFFNEHLRGHKFPMNTVWLTGEVPEEEYKEEFPLEYELMEKEGER